MKTIKCKYGIGDRVMIKEIQRPGVVKAVALDYLGLQYSVAYWNDDNRKNDEWIAEDELEPRNTEVKV